MIQFAERDREIFTAHFDRCIIVDAQSASMPGKVEYTVQPVWRGVDRPIVGGWTTFNKKMALRMADAVTAGVVLYDLSIKTDINGQTYVDTTSKVYWRRADASLKKLGF